MLNHILLYIYIYIYTCVYVYSVCRMCIRVCVRLSITRSALLRINIPHMAYLDFTSIRNRMEYMSSLIRYSVAMVP